MQVGLPEISSSSDDAISLLNSSHPIEESRLKKYILNGVKIGSAVISSAGPVITYLPTGEYCMLDLHCGKWIPISTIVGQYIFTVSGSGGFTAGNGYFGSIALDTIYNYIFFDKEGFPDPTTAWQKLMRIMALTALAIPMPLQTCFMNFKDTSSVMLVLSIVSALAPSGYTAGIVLKKIIPDCSNRINAMLNNPALSRFKKINEEEFILEKAKNNIVTEATLLIHSLIKNSNDFFEAYKNMSPEQIVGEILRENKTNSIPLAKRTTFYNSMSFLGNTLGVITAIGPSMPVVANAVDFLEDYIPYPSLAIMMAILISYTTIYGNVKLCVDLFGKSARLAADFVEGNPVNSIAFQTHPVRTSATVALSFILSIFSYSLMYFLFVTSMMVKFENAKLLLDILLWFAVATIVLYHAASYNELFLLISKGIARHSKETVLYKIEDFIDLLSNMSPHTFSEFIEKLDENNNFKLFANEQINAENDNFDALYPYPSANYSESSTASGTLLSGEITHITIAADVSGSEKIENIPANLPQEKNGGMVRNLISSCCSCLFSGKSAQSTTPTPTTSSIPVFAP